MSRWSRICTCTSAPWGYSRWCLKPRSLLLRSRWSKDQRCNTTPNAAILDWKKVLAVLSLGWKTLFFLSWSCPQNICHTPWFYFFRFPVISMHLKMNVDKYKQNVYIKFSHLRANLKHGTAGLQHANRCGGLFQASFHVSCSITYTADCWVLLPCLVSVITFSVPTCF